MRIFSRTKSRIRQEPSVKYCWFTSAKLWVLVAKSGDENYTVVISFNQWQAHIHFDPIGPVCGGAILDEETILTSVFCVVRPFSNPPQVGFFYETDYFTWLILWVPISAETMAELFYCVNYGSSIIPSKVCLIISVMKT